MVSVVIALEIFWYAGQFGADFSALFSQRDAGLKFLFLVIGSMVVHEWIFLGCKEICRKIDIASAEKKLFAVVILAGIIIPFALMYGMGSLFIFVFGRNGQEFIFSISLMTVFLIMANINMIYLCFYLVWSKKYIKSLQVYYGNQRVDLGVKDIAYLFYYRGDYFVTSHKGICYETSLKESLVEFMELLDPISFFMINEQMIISRKSCTAFSEDENGRITVSLVPKPILPKPLQEENDHGLFDHLNFN
ncbi:MAG: hypothetical protein EON51_02025 [Acinetobacter sp.]|nr:MAG: hypothetical protein EON51_02025 [Acinetobacter sp.]